MERPRHLVWVKEQIGVATPKANSFDEFRIEIRPDRKRKNVFADSSIPVAFNLTESSVLTVNYQQVGKAELKQKRKSRYIGTVKKPATGTSAQQLPVTTFKRKAYDDSNPG